MHFVSIRDGYGTYGMGINETVRYFNDTVNAT